MSDPNVNPIGFLLELCQKHGYGFPVFTEEGSTGPDHCKKFTYKCRFQGQETLAESEMKKNAKREAAKNMVALLKEQNFFVEKNCELDISKRVKNGVTSLPLENAKNPISALQEYCQAQRIVAPNYLVTSLGGNSFISECNVLSKKTFGDGSTKKEAKIKSATKMCEELGVSCAKEELDSVTDSSLQDGVEDKNFTSMLNEWCQSNHKAEAVYVEKSILNGVYVVECCVGETKCEGKSLTKKGAKNSAASLVLEKLCQEDEKKCLRWVPPLQDIVSEAKERTPLKMFDLSDDDEEASSKLAQLSLDEHAEEKPSISDTH